MGQFARRRQSSSRTLQREIIRVCRGPLQQGAVASRADRYVKRYPSADFALALIHHHIMGLQSLRELQLNLAEDSHLTRQIGMRGISVSHLPKLLHERPTELWAPLVRELLGRLQPSAGPPALCAIDATFLRLGARLLSRQTGRAMDQRNAGAKFTAVINLDGSQPVSLQVSLGSGHDAQFSEQLVPADWEIAGTTFLFDRGYRKYPFYRDLIARRAHLVTPQAANDRFVAWWPRPVAASGRIVSDETGMLGGSALPESERMLLRRVVVRRPDGSELALLTTHLDLPADQVAALYVRRWQIEIFFRWLKRGLKLTRPLGYSRAAAEHTILAALVAYCLTLLLAEWELSPTTQRPVPRIARAVQRLRARLYQPATAAELQALEFL